jgi:hypothetical protein
MSSTTVIEYFLPISRAHLSGSVTYVTDSTIGQNSQEASFPASVSHAFSVVTIADPERPRTLSVDSGIWQDYSFELGLTEDGRLTTADVDNTGRAGAVLVTGVTAVAAGAALLAGHLPLAAALAATAVKVGEQPLGQAPPVATVGPVWAAFEQAHPEIARRTARLLKQQAAVESALDEARDQLRLNISDAVARDEHSQQVAALEMLLTGLDTDLDGLAKQFTAWRASTLTQSAQAFDELVPLDALPRWADGALQFPAGDQRASNFWHSVDRILATVGEPPAHTTSPAVAAADEFRMLRPRPVTLAHMAKVGDREVATRFDRILVMDHACNELFVQIRKSRNARRSTAVRLSALGALTGISYSGKSSAAGDTAALAALPADLSHSLDRQPPA